MSDTGSKRSIVDGYIPKSDPFAHQWEALRRSAHKKAFALFMDQGTGKTKVIFDTTAILYQIGYINGLLVLAPNDVHDQWLDEQLPLHLPDRIPVRAVAWDRGSLKKMRLVAELCERPLPDRLAILAMNHEAIGTKTGVGRAKQFCSAYRVLCAVDESQNYKTPAAKRTRNLYHVLRPKIQVARLLSGTPTETPFDLWAQMRFLDERILGFESLLAFKHHYGVFTKEYTQIVKQGKRQLHEYETLVEYQRLEELDERMAPFVYRVHKEECTDLPPKMRMHRRTHLSEAQAQVYEQLKEEGLALLEEHEAGKSVKVLPLDEIEDPDLVERIQNPKDRMSIKIKLTLMLRLQQCAGGFITDDQGTTRPIDPTPNPRQEALLELVKGGLAGPAKVLIWAQFRAEMEALKALLPDFALIYGGTPKAQRANDLARYKDPDSSLRGLIAHPLTLGTGQNLQVARTMIFYSNSFSSIRRRQAEDRAHRIGQSGTVSIYDLIGAPCDERALEVLSDKDEINSKLFRASASQLRELL